MATFEASRFDAENDPHKPKVGEQLPESVGGGVVGRVKTISASELTKMLMAAGPGELPFDLCKSHPDRPFVKYLVWRQQPDV